MNKIIKLGDLAKILRSKNAKPYLLTFDILFADEQSYQMVKNSQAINKEVISKLYGIQPEFIHIYEFDAARGIKITIPRPIPSGNVGDSDIAGTQQHAPLFEIEIYYSL